MKRLVEHGKRIEAVLSLLVGVVIGLLVGTVSALLLGTGEVYFFEETLLLGLSLLSLVVLLAQGVLTFVVAVGFRDLQQLVTDLGSGLSTSGAVSERVQQVDSTTKRPAVVEERSWQEVDRRRSRTEPEVERERRGVTSTGVERERAGARAVGSRPSSTRHSTRERDHSGRSQWQEEAALSSPEQNRELLERRFEQSESRSDGSHRPAISAGASVAWAASLSEVWQDYRENGDGFFNADGLRSFLSRHGVKARILSGNEVAGSKLVLGVTDERGQQVYLLPNFIEPLSAMEKWFDDEGTGDRTRRVTRVGRLAEMKRNEGDYSLVRRGAVS